MKFQGIIRLRIVAALCLFCAVLTDAVRAAEENSSSPVKVMSFNVRYGSADDGPNSWPNRREILRDVVKQFDPDFLGVQEAQPQQVDYLKKQFPRYGCLVEFREATPGAGESCAVFYRQDRWQLDEKENGTFWLSETPQVRGSKSWKAACPRIVTWGRFVDKTCKVKNPRAVYVYNTHFDHISQLARQKAAEMAARQIAGRRHKDPVVLMGDFNAGESSRPISYLTGREAGGELKLVDTFRVVYPGAKKVGTFGNFSGNDSGDKIDFIFTLPKTKVLDAEIVRYNREGRYPSDHFPVTAVLELR